MSKNFVKLAKKINKISRGVFDGEVVAYDIIKEAYLPIDTLQTLKEFGNNDCLNFKIVIFDILLKNNDLIMQSSFNLRKNKMGELCETKRVSVIKSIKVQTDENIKTEIENLYKKAKENKNEGLILKSSEDPYEPNSRKHWLKLKYFSTDRKETLDLIVMGGYYGNVNLKGS